jgi:hypothetical protein
MTDDELALRRRIFDAFARTGEPPELASSQSLRSLAAQHVVVLDEDDPGRVLMAHPFAGHRDGTRVTSRERTWWGNCAWDGLGIVAALGLRGVATLTSGDVTVRVADGDIVDAAIFHIAVPARHWWDDIGFT